MLVSIINAALREKSCHMCINVGWKKKKTIVLRKKASLFYIILLKAYIIFHIYFQMLRNIKKHSSVLTTRVQLIKINWSSTIKGLHKNALLKAIHSFQYMHTTWYQKCRWKCYAHTCKSFSHWLEGFIACQNIINLFFSDFLDTWTTSCRCCCVKWITRSISHHLCRY